jgi:hypothetical protein
VQATRGCVGGKTIGTSSLTPLIIRFTLPRRAQSLRIGKSSVPQWPQGHRRDPSLDSTLRSLSFGFVSRGVDLGPAAYRVDVYPTPRGPAAVGGR